MKKRAAALVAACLVLPLRFSRADDDAERRAKVAKLGRLVWDDKREGLCVCDLDGGNGRTTGVTDFGFLRVLPDRRRALCSGDGRVRIVDLATGIALVASADAPDDAFDAGTPAISPDCRYAVFWHGPKCGNLPADPRSFAVFDLDTGTHVDVGEIRFDDVRRPAHFEDPTSWWSDDGTLYACVGAEKREGDKVGERWRIIRWSPKDGNIETFAELPKGTRVRFADFAHGRAAYAIEPQQDYRFVPQVRDGEGRVLFERHGMVWGVKWEADGAAVRLRENSPDSPPVTTFWRVVPGEKAVEIPEFEPIARAAIDAASFVEERGEPRPKKGEKRKPWEAPEHELLRVNAATGEATRIGRGRAPRRVGDFVVFWRVTVPDKAKEGPYFEFPEVIPGKDDLWAYDPSDGAVFRLTDCGFKTHAWEIVPTGAK